MSGQLLTRAQYATLLTALWQESLDEIDMQDAIAVWEGEGGR